MTHNVEIDGHKVLGFDTGLSARAFAQAKFAQFIAEPGLFVRPASGGTTDGVALWKASGVREVADIEGRQSMVVWGPPVEGERLDSVLNAVSGVAGQEAALAAVCAWIRAVLALQNTAHDIPLWPCAATIMETGDPSQVFFAPPTLTRLCTMATDKQAQFSGQYVHPDLGGMSAAAFTAAAMLYKVFAGVSPFTATEESLLHQDMREGNFLPIHFAVPGLNGHLASLIQQAMTPAAKKSITSSLASGLVGNSADSLPIKGESVLSEMLGILQKGGSAASLVQPLAEEDRLLLEKEKNKFLKIKTASVKTKRFVARNDILLVGIIGAVVVVIIAAVSLAQSRARLPTTAGMDPVQVIESYYNAIGELNHQMMDACVIGGAGKNDISMVINFFVITRVRQNTELSAPPAVISARDWQEGKAEISGLTQVIGVTDLRVQWLAGGDSGDGDNGNGGEEARYQADYTLWIPVPAIIDPESLEVIETPFSEPHARSDLLTLVHKKGNWRICEIQRVTDN